MVVIQIKPSPLKCAMVAQMNIRGRSGSLYLIECTVQEMLIDSTVGITVCTILLILKEQVVLASSGPLIAGWC